VTDRQTDHATRSVAIGRVYIHSTVMRPNNTHVSVSGAVVTVSRFVSSPCLFDERRLSAGCPTALKPSQPTWAVSPLVGCCRPHTSSPFIISAHSKSWRSSYCRTECRWLTPMTPFYLLLLKPSLVLLYSELARYLQAAGRNALCVSHCCHFIFLLHPRERL